MGCGAVVGRRLSAREKLQNFAFQARASVLANCSPPLLLHLAGKDLEGGWGCKGRRQ